MGEETTVIHALASDLQPAERWPDLHFLHGRFSVTDQSKRQCQMEVYVFKLVFDGFVCFSLLGSHCTMFMCYAYATCWSFPVNSACAKVTT